MRWMVRAGGTWQSDYSSLRVKVPKTSLWGGPGRFEETGNPPHAPPSKLHEANYPQTLSR
jgi:hypothetical protein